MKEIKPEWYVRMKKGPFQDTFDSSEIIYKLEQKVNGGRSHFIQKRTGAWTAAGLTALLLICAISLYPQLLSVLPASQTETANASGGFNITHGYIKQHLHVGMSEKAVIAAIGKPMQQQAVMRDFAQPHVEDPDDMNTWSKVDMWRYDFGVREGYEVKSNIDEANGFDLSGIANGDIKSQLVIIWKDGTVNRAMYRFNISGGSAVSYSEIGPVPAQP